MKRSHNKSSSYLSPHIVKNFFLVMRTVKINSLSNFQINNTLLLAIRASTVVLVVKNLPANAEDASSIPGLGRCPGEGNNKPLQYSHLGNPMDRGTEEPGGL